MADRDTAVVLVAGGSAERFGRTGGKQLAPLAGRPVVAHAFAAAAATKRVGFVVVVCAVGRVEEYAAVLAADTVKIETCFVSGGERRQDSVAAGIAEVPSDYAYICIHDGARPLATPALFDATLAALDADESLTGAVVGYPPVDTLKSVAGNLVTGTPDRATLRAVQTPQTFRASALRAAYDRAASEGWEGTDDASFVEMTGGAVALIVGPRENIKITHGEDLVVAEALLRAGSGEVCR